jgi:cobalt-precorrin-7 (C5)-methyltransferase
MAAKIVVIGTGPGDARYMSPIALEAIGRAEVLVGGQRLLDAFAGPEQIQYPVERDLPRLIEFIQEQRKRRRVAVMVSGDTGIFSLATYLLNHFDREEMEFIPGISSLQVMFARLKRSWHEAAILSTHGRGPEHLLAIIKNSPLTALFTGAPWTPVEIARYLKENGVPDLQVALGKDLSYPEEQIIYTSLELLTHDQAAYNNTVMVIFNE